LEKNNNIPKILWIIFFLITPLLNAQVDFKYSIIDTFSISIENYYKISSNNIIPFSENLFISDKKLSRDEYTISYEKGIINLSNSLSVSLIQKLIVEYEYIRTNFSKEYKRRSLVYSFEKESTDSARIIKIKQSTLTPESIFGSEIQKSGALIRGFSVGTNRDFQLNSGLRLQLSGKLSDDLEIVAALSDENTPIQPEGNTETLEELDKVFIEIRHKNAVGTFGDFEFVDNKNQFAKINRKLQGLKGNINFNNHVGSIAIAGSRGKYNSNQFNGLDGSQGPYRLYGANNEREIILIAGSERVYINGELLKRGDNNDYVIDYSNSEINFTPKRLITSATRISVDFEYTDQHYKRNFFGLDYSTKLFNDRLDIGFSFYSEGDDENNPIDFRFSDEDYNILRNAGDNRSKAVISGVTLAEKDSLGNYKGIYTKIDTTISGNLFSFYKYQPGIISSIYNVAFSFVGIGNGDYQKISLGQYKFVGKNNGSYLPIKFIPLPESRKLFTFFTNTEIVKGINLNLELSGSSWDRNKFSNFDDADNFGIARKILVQFIPQEIKIGDFNIGKIGFGFKDRYIQNRYTSLDRIDEVEFSRNYNITSSEKLNQILREFDFYFQPFNKLSVNSKYGLLKQGNNFSSNRFYSELKLSEDDNYHVTYNIDFVKTKNSDIKSNWNRQLGNAYYLLGSLKPGLEFIYEKKEDIFSDSLLATSLKYLEVIPFIEYNFNSSFTVKTSYSLREEFFPLHSQMERQSTSNTKQLAIVYKGIKEINSSFNINVREKKYSNDFKRIGFLDNETILLLSQSKFNLWDNFILGDLFYQVSTEQSAKYEKVFVKVPKGTGSYIFLGDLNNNGLQEENEFQLTSYEGEFIVITVPTDQLFPVVDLKANTRWKIDFSRLVSGTSLLENIIKPISTETSWRIEENSKTLETSDIYFFHLSKFLNDSTTIRGSQLLQNDLHLFQFNPEFSIRFRFLQRRNLNQYWGGNEKGFYKERGIRIRFRMIKEISNQTEFINQIDNMVAPLTSNRARNIDRNDLSTEFSYRPLPNLETSFKIQVGTSRDEYTIRPNIIDNNSIVLRLNYAITNIGRLTLEMERTELISNSSNQNIPFEITRGNVIGKNYFWRVNFDYRLASYIQTTFYYEGRVPGKSKVIHTMRAEARAYF
jgi:hypothetical protein